MSLNTYMSTSAGPPNSAGANTLITPNFATNLVSNNTLALFHWRMSTAWVARGLSPCPFDMVITLSTPFLYNPPQGFLMIDTQVMGLTGVNRSIGRIRREKLQSARWLGGGRVQPNHGDPADWHGAAFQQYRAIRLYAGHAGAGIVRFAVCGLAARLHPPLRITID